jgi:signal transduction histidine kinase
LRASSRRSPIRRWRRKPSSGPLPDLVSDRLGLEQIFGNLIDNALKYLKNGVPGDIHIQGRTKLGFAIYEITDNGRGIDPKDHQRIFDLFRRAGTQDRPGQGIGLAHVRALVRRLGGTMSVASELGRGSTFTVTLPINWNITNRNRET